ncbi:MAG: 2Fe-2S iron-sulfur cluster-binding protein [Candidatus Borkfalkia sp.]
MIVKVLSGGNTRELECEKGENLLALLQRHGYHITARCGGRGSCGKCKVKVLQGAFENQREDFVLSCLATVGNDCAVEVFETEGGGLTYARAALSAADGEEGFGVALDIGTTTMAFRSSI